MYVYCKDLQNDFAVRLYCVTNPLKPNLCPLQAAVFIRAQGLTKFD